MRLIDQETLAAIAAQKDDEYLTLGQLRQATKSTSAGQCYALARLVDSQRIKYVIDNVNGLHFRLVEIKE